VSAYNAPWLGRNWNATAGGLGTPSLASCVLGLSQVNVMLGGGDTVVADDDSVSFLAIVEGSAGVNLPLPLGPTFVDFVLNAQVVAIVEGSAGVNLPLPLGPTVVD
jgi:hypothetical protein